MPFFTDLVAADGSRPPKKRQFCPQYVPLSTEGKPLRSRLENVPREIDVSTLLARARESGFSVRYYVTDDIFGEFPVSEEERQAVEQMFCRLALHLADVWGVLIGAVDVSFEPNILFVRAQLIFDDGSEVIQFAIERGRVRVRDVYSRFESVVKAHYEIF